MSRPVTSRPPIAPLRAPALALAWTAVVAVLLGGATGDIPSGKVRAQSPAVVKGTELAQVPSPSPTPEPPSPASPEAKVVLTVLNGSGPVPEVWPLGFPIGLTAEKSVMGNSPKSIKWEISPAFLDQYAYRINGGKQITIGTGLKPIEITIRCSVAKGDTIDEQTVVIRCVTDPDHPDVPTPTPGPVPPGPTPSPTPIPTPTPGPSPNPGPVPGFDAPLNGRAFGREMLDAVGDSLVLFGQDISAGKPIDQARKDHAARWKKSVADAFDRRFVPALDRLIPPDTAPNTEQRRRYDELIRSMAGGMKGPIP